MKKVYGGKGGAEMIDGMWDEGGKKREKKMKKICGLWRK
jgi:hypothetical protein